MFRISKHAYLFMGMLINLTLLNGQIQYQMAYGGAQNDEGRSVIPFTNGYVISGSTNSFGAGSSDFYLIGLDTCGNLTISKTVGGTNSDGNFDLLKSFAGRFVLYGRTNSFGVADYDTYLTELNSTVTNVRTSWVVGDTLKEEGQAIVEAIDTTGFVGAGFTNSFGAGNYDVYVIKYRYNGTVAWTKVFGGTSLDKAYDIQTTSDGGFIVTGETKSFGEGLSDVYLLKLNSNGTLAWTKTYGTEGNDIGYSVKQTLDGGYIITGITELGDSIPYGKNIYLIKTNSAGAKTWSFAYGGDEDDEGHSVVQLTDSSYAICGFTKSYGAGNDDAYLLKTTKTGTLSWGMVYGGDTIDRCFCLLRTADSGYFLAGQTLSFGAGKSDVYAVKTNNSGISICFEDSGAVRYTIIDSVQSGGSSSSGGTLNTGGILNSPATLVDTLCNNCGDLRLPFNGNNYLENSASYALVFPNPTDEILNISLINTSEGLAQINILDLSGSLVKSFNFDSGSASLDVSRLEAGVYIVKIEIRGEVFVSKFIKN